jgi:hypothetical protein
MTRFATTALLAAAAFLTAPLAAQNPIFSEDFANGIPATWGHLELGAAMDPWTAGFDPVTNNPDAFHEWHCFSGAHFRDNILVTPAIDLSGLHRVDFSCKQHQVFPQQRFLNRVEVSTDGGNVFVPIYTEIGTWSGPGTISLSLDAFAGLPDVRIGFHYQGTIANEWRIDNVRVTTPQPLLAITGTTAGAPTTYAIAGAEPNALVLLGLSITGGGVLPSPFGPVLLSPPIFLEGPMIVDPNGNASLGATYPVSAIGVQLFAHPVQLGVGGLTLARAGTFTLQ